LQALQLLGINKKSDVHSISRGHLIFLVIYVGINNPIESVTALVRRLRSVYIGIYLYISSHTNFGNHVATICQPHTYNVQVKNATTLENGGIATFLLRLQVPEDEISGTLPLLAKFTQVSV